MPTNAESKQSVLASDLPPSEITTADPANAPSAKAGAATGGGNTSTAATGARTPEPAGEPRDGIELVVQMHNKLRSLITDFKAVDSVDGKLKAVEKIITEASRYASASERTVLPLVMSRLPQHGEGSEGGDASTARALQDRCVVDHVMAKELLSWLDTHTPVAPGDWSLFNSTMDKAITVIMDHLLLMEREVLDPLRAALSSHDLDRVARDWDHALSNAPHKPHPGAFSTTPLAHLAHPVAGAMDRTVEAVKSLAAGAARKLEDAALGVAHMIESSIPHHEQQQQQLAAAAAAAGGGSAESHTHTE